MPSEQAPASRTAIRRVPLWVERLTTRIAPAAAAVSAAMLLWHAAHDAPAPFDAAPAPLIYKDAANARATPAQAAPAPAPGPADAHRLHVQQAGVAVSTIEVVVGRNDTLDRIFRRMALDKGDLAAIRNLPGIRQSIDFLKPGESIKVTHSGDGAIEELTRKVSETETLQVVRRDDGFAAQMIDNPVETRVRTATATIDSSLFQAAETAGIADATTLRFANIFAWDIDFITGLREGDRFTVVYEEIWQNGARLHDGEILSAEFVNDGKVYRAVRYTPAGGQPGYYSPQGRPLRKAFLRTPVEFTRVSSAFNPHRLHPILNRIRGHMGTDYAAPAGTPVHAASDGRVSFEGRRGGYGNALMLTHSTSVATLYGHLSRFAPHLHVGSRVQQGEVIGYVGMTGLATGPHLHYEYLVNGVHKNPQTVQLPAAEPLSADAMRDFAARTAPLLGRLEPQPAERVASNLARPASPARPDPSSVN